MAELIDMPFEELIRVGPRNHIIIRQGSRSGESVCSRER